MINSLIENIQTKLTDALSDVLPSPASEHVTSDYSETVDVAKLPLVRLFAGKIEGDASLVGSVRIEEGKKRAQRELKQKLIVEVFHTGVAGCETLASLILGILTVEAGELLIDSTDTVYTSQLYSVSHHYRDLLFEEGETGCDVERRFSKLTYRVTGSVDIVKTISEGFETIDEIVGNGKDGTSI